MSPRPDVDPTPDPPISTYYDLVANMPYESSAASTTTQTGSATATNPKKKIKIDENDRAKWKVHLRAGGGGADAEKWFAIHGTSTRDLPLRAAETALTPSLSVRLFVLFQICAWTRSKRRSSSSGRLYFRCVLFPFSVCATRR